MRQATKTQIASEEADRTWCESREAIIRSAKQEFPVGTKVKWQHVHGKPMTKATVIAVGGLYVGDVNWDIKTASGAAHRVNAARLYPEDAPE